MDCIILKNIVTDTTPYHTIPFHLFGNLYKHFTGIILSVNTLPVSPATLPSLVRKYWNHERCCDCNMMITLWCGMRRHAPRTWFLYTQPARWCGVIAVRYLTQTHVDVYYVLEYSRVLSSSLHGVNWICVQHFSMNWELGVPCGGTGIQVEASSAASLWCLMHGCMQHEPPRPPFHILPKVHTCKRGYFFSYTTFVLDSIRAFVGLMDTLYSQKPCRDFSLG